jgi:dipeptidyl-peptidase-4
MKYFLLIIAICISGSLVAQKEITVEDIWQNYTFMAKSVPGFNFQNDGKHYTRLEGNRIQQYDLTSGIATKVIFDGNDKTVNQFEPSKVVIRGMAAQGQATTTKEEVPLNIDSYQFSPDESKILIFTATASIYRRSSKEHAYVWNTKTQKLSNVTPMGKQMYTSFSPSADKIAYVRNNDLYVRNLKEEKEQRITSDGKFNHIINGSADWVYEEEFSMSKSFEWSPDGSKIAFLRFDESNVKEFTMQMYHDDTYPENVTFKYPKVGEDNAIVTVHIYDLETGKTIEVKTGTAEYFPRLFWTNSSNQLVVFKMNRHQNELELLKVDANTGETTVLLKETNKYYIDIHDNLTFLKDGKQYLWTSEMTGYNHIYLYDMAGKMKAQLTKGAYDVTDFYGYDEKNKKVFYQTAEKSPLQRQVYSVGLDGKNKKEITPVGGTNEAQFSSTFDYYVNTHSAANEPASYTVYDRKGKLLRVIEDNQGIKDLQVEYGTTPVEFFDFTTSEKVKLNGYMIKPPDFDSRQAYPVFMYVYGGPGSQTVTDAFGGFNYWWFQMLAQNGFIVVSVDNRGTGARGEEFRKMTYLQLGKYETMDQIEAAKYLGGLPYVDKERIGIFGWSYGGYMSSLCLSKGADVFKAAIAVAPVTNWKWYDSIYTERYMRTEKENPDGYKENSPVYFADLMKGDYLLVHGIGDDNVHFQNSVEMTNALVMAGKQFDSYFYPNRNHGIYGGNTRHHLYTKMTNFVLENLKNTTKKSRP